MINHIMIDTHENGGLNMIDIESHSEVLKASWIGRIVSADIARRQLIPFIFKS